MKLAAIVCAVLACTALDSQAAGARGSFGHGFARVHPGFVHPGFRGRVVVGAAFVGLGAAYWANAWPGYYYPPPVYYAPPPPVIQYWYYCAPLGAYYPYVPSCPGPWQPVPAAPYTY